MAEPATTQTPQRLERALVAFVRQEFAAPVTAIIGFAEILLEDVRRSGLDALAADLDRIRAAGAQLQELLGKLVDLALPSGQTADGDFDAFRARLRHDLRTPLNAVKGYGEMIMEEARAAGREALVVDIARLLGAADQLLTQVDMVMAFTGGTAAVPGGPGPFTETQSQDLVRQVIDSIRPVELSPVQARNGEVPSRILVVDDTDANRELLSRRLGREGHVVEMVGDGKSALERVASANFDLVLLDLMMPDMNGFEVLCRLKADPATRHIPVIMISALDELDSIVRCVEAGAEDYLPKPFNAVLLRARIDASLEKKRLRDREQAFTEQLRAERDKSEALLLNILPRTIVTRMREGETKIADRFDEVTILFSDLVGFTGLASRLSPGQLIDLLNHLFSDFDRVAMDLGLEKIKTIGDAYMVAGGLPEPRPDHALAIADMALRMIEVVGEAESKLGEPLQVRVGIHSGDVVAGIIGRHKFIYDVWGDTVNTASRLESHGLPGCIHISEATYRRVCHIFECRSRGSVDLKGKGPMRTYFLGARIC